MTNLPQLDHSPTPRSIDNRRRVSFGRQDYRADWETYCAARPHARASELRTLLDASQGNQDGADQVLADIVGRAATDPEMARLALQRVMPGILAIATRRARQSRGTFDDVLADLVGNAWIAIRTYPLARRPRKIAANLVRDIEYNTFVQPNRLRRVATETLTTATDQAVPGECHAAETLVAILAAARAAGADAADIRLLGELTVGGHAVGDLALRYDVSPRTILNRRRLAERNVRIVLGATATDTTSDDLTVAA